MPQSPLNHKSRVMKGSLKNWTYLLFISNIHHISRSCYRGRRHASRSVPGDSRGRSGPSAATSSELCTIDRYYPSPPGGLPSSADSRSCTLGEERRRGNHSKFSRLTKTFKAKGRNCKPGFFWTRKINKAFTIVFCRAKTFLRRFSERRLEMMD